jgi:ribosomal protein L37AE/L43A
MSLAERIRSFHIVHGYDGRFTTAAEIAERLEARLAILEGRIVPSICAACGSESIRWDMALGWCCADCGTAVPEPRAVGAIEAALSSAVAWDANRVEARAELAQLRRRLRALTEGLTEITRQASESDLLLNPVAKAMHTIAVRTIEEKGR